MQFLLLEVSNVLTDGLVEIERPLRKKCRRDRQCHKQSNREIRNRLMKEGKSFLTRLSESCQGMWGRIINTSCALCTASTTHAAPPALLQLDHLSVNPPSTVLYRSRHAGLHQQLSRLLFTCCKRPYSRSTCVFK